MCGSQRNVWANDSAARRRRSSARRRRDGACERSKGRTPTGIIAMHCPCLHPPNVLRWALLALEPVQRCASPIARWNEAPRPRWPTTRASLASESTSHRRTKATQPASRTDGGVLALRLASAPRLFASTHTRPALREPGPLHRLSEGTAVRRPASTSICGGKPVKCFSVGRVGHVVEVIHAGPMA